MFWSLSLPSLDLSPLYPSPLSNDTPLYVDTSLSPYVSLPISPLSYDLYRYLYLSTHLYIHLSPPLWISFPSLDRYLYLPLSFALISLTLYLYQSMSLFLYNYTSFSISVDLIIWLPRSLLISLALTSLTRNIYLALYLFRSISG